MGSVPSQSQPPPGVDVAQCLSWTTMSGIEIIELPLAIHRHCLLLRLTVLFRMSGSGRSPTCQLARPARVVGAVRRNEGGLLGQCCCCCAVFWPFVATLWCACASQRAEARFADTSGSQRSIDLLLNYSSTSTVKALLASPLVNCSKDAGKGFSADTMMPMLSSTKCKITKLTTCYLKCLSS